MAKLTKNTKDYALASVIRKTPQKSTLQAAVNKICGNTRNHYREIASHFSLLLSAIVSGVSTLTIWAFSRVMWSTMLFGIVFGGAAGGFAVLRSRFAAAIVGNDDDAQQALDIFGALTFIRGVAQVASGFIGAALVQENMEVQDTYGTGKWTRLMIFVGAAMIAASSGALTPLKTHN